MTKQKATNLAFSKILKQELAKRRITLGEVSKITGTSTSVVHGWTYGSQPRDIGAVAKLAEAFNIPLYYLLFGKNDPTDDEGTNSTGEKSDLFNSQQEVFDLINSIGDVFLKHHRKKNQGSGQG